MGLMQLVNGLTQNTTTPIASKLAEVYGISSAYVTAPITVSFLAYSLMNFPANHIIDTKGLRFSFVLGSGLYMAGAALYTLVNKGYFFTIFGSILVSLGQPFIINCPAKIATYWFFDKNVQIIIIVETFCNWYHDRFNVNWYRFWLFITYTYCI
jgi:MFS family permease